MTEPIDEVLEEFRKKTFDIQRGYGQGISKNTTSKKYDLSLAQAKQKILEGCVKKIPTQYEFNKMYCKHRCSKDVQNRCSYICDRERLFTAILKLLNGEEK